MQHAPSTQAGSSSSTSLKRTRSGEYPRAMSTSGGLEIPRLPEINTDLVLEVYTHESLRPLNATTAEMFADNRRLDKLGEKVLDTAVTFALFKKRPLLSGEEIKDQAQKIMHNDVIQGWVKSYQMASRIICLAEYKAKREEPEECRRVFCAYVGAVFSQSGQEVVGKWIELLVQYNEQQQNTSSTPTTATSSSSMSGGTGSDIPPAKKIKNEPTNSSLTSFGALSPTPSTVSTSTSSTSTTTPSSTATTTQAYSPTAPYLNTPHQYPSAYPARQLPPHMFNKTLSYHHLNGGGGGGGSSGAASVTAATAAVPTPQNWSALYQSLAKLSQSPALKAVTANQSQKTSFGSSTMSSRPNPLAPATPNAPFLPMFNQSAAQRGVKVDYSAEFEGPAHAGQWSVECLVNGIPKGKGKGSSKQIAKEEAAREAYYSMGWT